MIRSLFVFIAVLSFAPAAVAQATRPTEKAPTAAEQAWPKAMAGFAKALMDGDMAAMDKLLSPRASIRRFDGPETDESWRLFERVQKSTLVGQHAYQHPPLVMAADLSADFKNAAAVPDKAKIRFMVDDETEMKRANATAAQWVGEQLDARGGAPVGVVVLYTPRAAPPGITLTEPAYDIVFVLCRGELVGSGKYRITTVVYGTPVQDAHP